MPLLGVVLCGWIISDSPLTCHSGNYQPYPPLDYENSPEGQWHTCQEREKAPDGERILSEDEKQWLKWRSFDLEEADASRLDRNELASGPFRKVSFEFISGVR